MTLAGRPEGESHNRLVLCVDFCVLLNLPSNTNFLFALIVNAVVQLFPLLSNLMHDFICLHQSRAQDRACILNSYYLNPDRYRCEVFTCKQILKIQRLIVVIINSHHIA